MSALVGILHRAEAWGRSLLSASQPLRPADVPVPEVATAP